MGKPGLAARRHAFTRRFRGFDKAEVEAVVQAAALACEEAHATVRQLEQALADATVEAERLREGERAVIRIIRSGDEHARMCLGSAHRQASRIVEAAEEQARAWLAQAEEERTALANETRAIERRRDQALSTLGGLIETMAPKTLPDADATEAPPAVHLPGPPPGMTAPTAADGPKAAAAPHAGPRAEPVGNEAAVARIVLPDETLEERSPDEVLEGPAAVVTSTRGRWLSMSTRRAAMAAAAVVLSAAAIAWPSVRGSRQPGAPAPVAAPAPAPLAVHEAGDDGLATTAAAAPAVGAPAVPEQAPIAPVVVRLTSRRSCWVRVTVDGRAEEIMLAAGDDITRSGEGTIRVRIGDAGAAALEVNGQELPPLGRDGQVVERTFTATTLPR
jgi:hypothetical protein